MKNFFSKLRASQIAIFYVVAVLWAGGVHADTYYNITGQTEYCAQRFLDVHSPAYSKSKYAECRKQLEPWEREKRNMNKLIQLTFECRPRYDGKKPPQECVEWERAQKRAAKEQALKVKKSAKQGNADAQNQLGMMYWKGEGVAKDDVQAVAWFTKAAEQGNVDAQNQLGMMYWKGLGVAKDNAQAVAWYTKAADQINADAQHQNQLGVMYWNEKDDAHAVAWFTKAAKQGFAPAQTNLGNMYQEGKGVTQDDAQAVEWFRKAAEQGYARAQFLLGAMYMNGRSVAQSDTQAAAWFTKAAQQGFAPAQNLLGVMYGKGKGVTQDDTQAVVWFRTAADHGLADAQYNLGVMYQIGRGVAKDDAQAAALFTKAAEQGFAPALQCRPPCINKFTETTERDSPNIIAAPAPREPIP